MADGSDSSSTSPNTRSEQVVIITGSGSGVGRASALAFAALNCRLVLVDTESDSLAGTSELCSERSPDRHKPLELCVKLAEGEEAAHSVVKATIDQLGRLDIVVNNGAHADQLTRFDDENCVALYHKVVASNMHSTVYMCLAAYPWLKLSRGAIVNVSSVVERQPSQYRFGLCMSKAAVAMLTKCLANDFAPFVRVNCISPGPVASSILDDLGMRHESDAATSPARPRGVAGEPDEVAKMIIYLASRDKAASITGSRVLVGPT